MSTKKNEPKKKKEEALQQQQQQRGGMSPGLLLLQLHAWATGTGTPHDAVHASSFIHINITTVIVTKTCPTRLLAKDNKNFSTDSIALW